jgi:hypothetical protein
MEDNAVIMSKEAVKEILCDGIGEFESNEFETAVQETSCIGLNCFSYLNQLATNIDRKRG